MKKAVVIAALVTWLGAAAIVAQGGESTDQSAWVVTEIDAQSLVSIARKAGAIQAEVKPLDSGGQYLILSDGTNTVLILMKVCNDQSGKCRGLWLLAPFEQPTPNYSLEQFNAFNISSPYASAFILDSNVFILARYVITDAGVTPEHLAQSIRIFWEMPEAFVRHIQPSRTSGAPLSATRTPEAAFLTGVHDVIRMVKPNHLPDMKQP